MRSMKLDNRPKKLLVKGTAGDDDALDDRVEVARGGAREEVLGAEEVHGAEVLGAREGTGEGARLVGDGLGGGDVRGDAEEHLDGSVEGLGGEGELGEGGDDEGPESDLIELLRVAGGAEEVEGDLRGRNLAF